MAKCIKQRQLKYSFPRYESLIFPENTKARTNPCELLKIVYSFYCPSETVYNFMLPFFAF